MRAALFRRHGGPEVMEIGDVPTPTPGPGEVQIRVTAAALNHIDLWLRQGLPALPVPLPHVSGGDVCGVGLASWARGSHRAQARRSATGCWSIQGSPAAAAWLASVGATISAPTIG